jgi:hypothetical protein
MLAHILVAPIIMPYQQKQLAQTVRENGKIDIAISNGVVLCSESSNHK